MNAIIVFFDFIIWWYTKGFIMVLNNLFAIFKYLAVIFSVKESIVNLFSPWKRLVGARKPGLDGIRDWVIDNIISRGVGFFMRAMLLLFFLIVLIVFLGISLSIIFLWLFWPIILTMMLIWSF